MTFSVTLLFALTFSFQGTAQDNVVFPAGANITDVTQPPYNADPTGSIDATGALQEALNTGGNIIYLPNGTYLVSSTLRWPGKATRKMFWGQSTAGVVIKLQDNADGYADAGSTQAVIYTGKRPAQRFQNYIRNLTVNTGSGNPGATGIQFMANNVGAMYDVLIKSDDGQGLYGLDLGYSDEQGPCLIKNVEVHGFDVGIRTKNGVNSVTMEDVTLTNQNNVGLSNSGQVINIRNLTSNNSGRAVVNIGSGLLTLIDSELNGIGSASEVAAIYNSNGLFARNVTTSGYQKAVENAGGNQNDFDGAVVGEFVSHDVVNQFPSPLKSLNLPIKETPEVPWSPMADWVNVADYLPAQDTSFARCDGTIVTIQNWRKAFQDAIDAGAENIYLPRGGSINVVGDIYVRGNVQRISGMLREVRGAGCEGDREFGFRFIVEAGTAPVVVIELFNATYNSGKVVHRSGRKLVVRDLLLESSLTVEAGAGEVYLQDVYVSSLITAPSAKIWARQLNTEGKSSPRLLNNAATLWVLGLKTENDKTVLLNTNGGETEILGGFIYANKNRDPDKIIFDNDESSFSATFGEFVTRDQPFNPIKETRDGITKTITAEEAPYNRGGGSMFPLYTGYSSGATSAPAAPSALTAQSEGPNKISLTWTDNANNEDGFYLERKVGATGTFAQIAAVAPDKTASKNANLFDSVTYTYRLRAFNGAGNSDYSNEVTVTTEKDTTSSGGNAYQAEDYTSKKNGAVLSSTEGFTGTGFFQLKYQNHWFQ